MINKIYLLILLFLTRILIYSQTNPAWQYEPDSSKYFINPSVKTISGNNSTPISILFSPDGKYLAYS